MSLDDFTNSIDKAVIAVDGKIIGLHAKVAQHWQNRTYRPKEDLSDRLHSTAAGLYGAAFLSYFMIIPKLLAEPQEPLTPTQTAGVYSLPVALAAGAIRAGCKSLGKFRAKPRHEEKESLYADGIRNRVLDIHGFLCAPVYSVCGAIFIAAGVQQSIPEATTAGVLIGGGATGYWLGKVADYLDRVEIGPPPKEVVTVLAAATE